MGSETSHLIVVVGGSAGGLEPIQQLLGSVPPATGAAFIIVQHLDPTHGSELAEILGRSTELPVRAIRNGMPLEADNVYVMPPESDVVVDDGCMWLVERESPGGMHLPIDLAMRSVAETFGGGVGVVMSGTGSDGTIGLGAIRAAGGVTFAQDPATAAYQSMPTSAIEAGVVDIVATAGDIGAEIARVFLEAPLPGPPVQKPDEAAFAASSQFTAVLDLLHKRSGTDFTAYKHGTIVRRLRRRMALRRTEDIGAYFEILKTDTREVDALLRDVLIMVTGFFREPEAFDTLAEHAFAELPSREDPDAPIRVWVPGCGTGQEAYSLLIALNLYLQKVDSSRRVQMFASDVSEDDLARARRGFYPLGIAAEMPAETLRRYFTQVEHGYQVSAALREQCIFAKHDLTRDPPFSDLDIISCRNLLIYFGPALQHRVLGLFHYGLRPGGFLLLGDTEGIGTNPTLFESLDQRHRLFRRADVPSQPGAGRFSMGAGAGAWAPRISAASKRPSDAGFRELANAALLDHYAAAGLLVDDELRIVQFLGRTGRYLEPRSGDANLNLFAIVRQGLSVDLHSALNEATRTNASAAVSSVRLEGDDGVQLIDLEVVPLDRADRGRAFLVIFSQPRNVPALPAPLEGAESTAERREIAYLTRELETTRQVMQAVVDEKDAANEELTGVVEASQSSNEELQSIGEELETAKEELQSTNEELTTVNDELQSRNAELGVVNDDLNNLLFSLQIPMVMLDRDLMIRRHTPGNGAVLDLTPSDVGRPFTDAALRIQNVDAMETVRAVMTTGHVVTQDVQDADGRWHLMVVRPYSAASDADTEGSGVRGAVILFLDIDSAKRGQIFLEESSRLSDALGEIDVAIYSPGLANRSLIHRLPVAAVAMKADEAIALSRVEGGWKLEDSWGQAPPPEVPGTVFSGDTMPVAETVAASMQAAVVSKADQAFEVGPTGSDRFAPGSALVIPMLAGDRTVGVLYLAYHDPAVRFTESQLDFVRKLIISMKLANEAASSRELLADAVEKRTADLNRAVLALEEALSVKNRFLADVSHELRTPLNSIIGFSSILESGGAGELPEEAHRQIGFVHESGTQLLAVVDTLLESSSIEAGVISPKIAAFELGELLGTIESTMGPQAASAGLDFVVHSPTEKIVMVSDCGRIREILFNLIGNALKFTKQGSITLDTGVAGGLVRFAVTDTGVGVAPADMTTILEPFRQLAQPGVAKTTGVGLGLAISSQLAVLLGGKITVTSELGQGSTFTLMLPLERPATSMEAQTPSEA